MASQLNSRPSSPTKPQGSPYCADPECESCRELREMQERIRSENLVPQMAPETNGKEIPGPASRVPLPGNGASYHRGN
jgi:hypothetical protein